MMSEEKIWPDIAIPPGVTLAETLETMAISQAELARRAGRPVQAISEIIQGKKEITPETALALERVLGIPAHVWIQLEADYRIIKARLADRERLKAEVSLAALCPYQEMSKKGWVPAVTDPVKRVQALLRFFGVASLHQMQSFAVGAAWRRAKTVTISSSSCALAAWLRQGELEAQQIETAPFDAAGLLELIPTLRSLTRAAPEVFQPQLVQLLSRKGVGLVFVPELPKTGAHGATRWMGGKAVVQLSLRLHWADIFWFTLFHELAHILKHGRKEVFIEVDTDREDEREREADAFASKHLIPEPAYAAFTTDRKVFSTAVVAAFACCRITQYRADHSADLGSVCCPLLRRSWEADSATDGSFRQHEPGRQYHTSGKSSSIATTRI
jgi:addiction module HigA family antidote